jgi:large subunit ribosomal protein L5
MISTTLRGKKAYDFIERLRILVLPRVRDFAGLNPKSFDKMGNYSIGLKDQSVFPEINYEDLQTLCGLQITIVPTTSSVEESRELLRSL